MGCNCGGSKTSQAQYIYTSATGQQTTYTSEVQAQAAVIREKAATGQQGSYKQVRA